MRPRLRGGDPAAGRAGDHARPHQERFAHLLDGGGLFTDSDRQRRHADRAAAEAAGQRRQHSPVESVETELVDVVDSQRGFGDEDQLQLFAQPRLADELPLIALWL